VFSTNPGQGEGRTSGVSRTAKNELVFEKEKEKRRGWVKKQANSNPEDCDLGSPTL